MNVRERERERQRKRETLWLLTSFTETCLQNPTSPKTHQGLSLCTALSHRRLKNFLWFSIKVLLMIKCYSVQNSHNWIEDIPNILCEFYCEMFLFSNIRPWFSRGLDDLFCSVTSWAGLSCNLWDIPDFLTRPHSTFLWCPNLLLYSIYTISIVSMCTLTIICCGGVFCLFVFITFWGTSVSW